MWLIVCVFTSYVYFLKMMYSGNNEAGDLEVLEIKIFFAAQPWWADFIEFFKNSFSGFYTLVMAYLKIS